MDWTADPAASAYEIVTQSGAHVQAGKTATTTKLGTFDPAKPMPKVGSAVATTFESPTNPQPPPPPPPPPPPTTGTVPIYGVCPGHASQTWDDATHAWVMDEMEKLANA
jgi:hypothetical protein